jgi:hypothetical protein
MIAHAKRHHKNLHMVQIDFSNAFGSVPQNMIEYNVLRMGIPEDIVNPVMDIYNGCETVIVTPAGQSEPIEWRSGTVQGCPLSPALFNICFDPFLRVMEQKVYKELGFPIVVESLLNSFVTIQVEGDGNCSENVAQRHIGRRFCGQRFNRG